MSSHNKNYDYAIYGAGPTGMTLAYLLAVNNYKVILIEKDTKLGGCWKHEWQNNKYFSEHSPRVLMKKNDYFFKILDKIGINLANDTVPTYGNRFQTNYKFIKFFWERLNWSDIKALSQSYFLGGYKNLTVSEWMNLNHISVKGQEALRIFSLLLANTPEKLLISELFGVSNFPVLFLQFKQPDKWINFFEQDLLLKNNVTILKQHELIKFNKVKVNKQNKISYKIKSGIVKNFSTEVTIFAKNHLLTLPPLAMKELLKNHLYHYQDEIIANNWFNQEQLEQWTEDSSYVSLGFQLHFKEEKEELNIPDTWCWSCSNDYNVILLTVSDYMDIYTKDSRVKTVLSCTIVDTEAYITHRKKRINQLRLDEIMSDVLKILKLKKPYKITFYDGLKHQDGKYISKDSAFSLGKSGVFPVKGNNITNLYTIGPHNKPGITVINKAVETAVEFVESKNISLPYYLQKTNYYLILLFLILLLVLYYSFKNEFKYLLF